MGRACPSYPPKAASNVFFPAPPVRVLWYALKMRRWSKREMNRSRALRIRCRRRAPRNGLVARFKRWSKDNGDAAQVLGVIATFLVTLLTAFLK